MKSWRHSACLLLAALPAFPEVVDRMVVVVNKQVILHSQLEQASRVEFLLAGRPPEQLTDVQMQPVLERLIDQALLEQQIGSTDLLDPSREELEKNLREIRSNLPAAQNEDKWLA